MNVPRLVLLPNPGAYKCRAYHVRSIRRSDMHQAHLFTIIAQYPEHLHIDLTQSLQFIVHIEQEWQTGFMS